MLIHCRLLGVEIMNMVGKDFVLLTSRFPACWYGTQSALLSSKTTLCCKK